MNISKSRSLLRMLECRSIEVSKLSSDEMDESYLSYLCHQKIIRLSQGVLYVADPIRLVLEAVKLGVDIEVASKWLNWRDFERLCVEALQSHGFNVKAPLRFKVNGKRREIDIVAYKKNVLLCIDCKHWKMKRGQQYKIKESAMNHLDKCMELAKLATSLRSMKLSIYSEAHLVPVMVSLMDLNLKHSLNGVWIVPVFKLNSFLIDLDTHLDEVSSTRIY